MATFYHMTHCTVDLGLSMVIQGVNSHISTEKSTPPPLLVALKFLVHFSLVCQGKHPKAHEKWSQMERGVVFCKFSNQRGVSGFYFSLSAAFINGQKTLLAPNSFLHKRNGEGICYWCINQWHDRQSPWVHKIGTSLYLFFMVKWFWLLNPYGQVQLPTVCGKRYFFVFCKYPSLAITRGAVREGGPRKSHQEDEDWKFHKHLFTG